MKKKIISMTSLLMSIVMTITACGNQNKKTEVIDKQSIPVEDKNIDETKDKENIAVPKEKVKSKIEEIDDSKVETFLEENSIIVETDKQERIEEENEKPANVEKRDLNHSELCSLIDLARLDSVTKDVLKTVATDFPNRGSEELLLRILNVDKENIRELLESFFCVVYNGVYKDIYSTGQTVWYPKDNIRIFDNRDGKVGLSNCVFMLADPSIYGNYKIYHESIAPHGGIIGSDIIITDLNDKVLICIKRFYNDITYEVVADRNIYVSSLGSYLESLGIDDYRTNYRYKDLFYLKYEISEKVCGFDRKPVSGKLNVDDILVLEIPSSTGSWFTSSAGKENKYYFLLRRGEYLFEENSSVYTSIFHDNAYVTFETTGLFGLTYSDSVEEVYINCDRDISNFDTIVPLRDFVANKMTLSLDTYSEIDIASLVLLFSSIDEYENNRSMQMLPVNPKQER